MATLRLPAYVLPEKPAGDGAFAGWLSKSNALLARNWQELELWSQGVSTATSSLPSTAISGLTSRQLVFGSPAGGVGQSAGLQWDSTVNGLGIGTSAPGRPLDVNGAGVVQGTFQSSATTVQTLQVLGGSTFAGTMVTSNIGAANLDVAANSSLHGSLQSSNTTVANLQVNGGTTLGGLVVSTHIATTLAAIQSQLNATTVRVAEILSTFVRQSSTASPILTLTTVAQAIPGMSITRTITSTDVTVMVDAVIDMSCDTNANVAIGELKITYPSAATSVQPNQVIMQPPTGTLRLTIGSFWQLPAGFSTGSYTFAMQARMVGSGTGTSAKVNDHSAIRLTVI